jgi:short-subunit dehydrogenase
MTIIMGMTALIIGGTSGLGLELAKQLSDSGDTVYITGRNNPWAQRVIYQKLDLNDQNLSKRLQEMFAHLPAIDLFVYAAGFYQQDTITDLQDAQIEEMLNVCGRGLIYSLKYLLIKQSKLDNLVVITSSAAYTPRKFEPVYNFAKAGEGHFANAMSEDERIGKVLNFAPSGMNTEFWENTQKNTTEMLDPVWVAAQIILQLQEPYKYRFTKALRQPTRLEVEESR